MRSTAREVLADTEAEGPELVFEAAVQAASNRLMDSLVHDARNPLNALSINLEVLTEKLKEGAERGQDRAGENANNQAVWRADQQPPYKRGASHGHQVGYA